MDNMNFDANTIDKLKDMMNKGELNDVISQIPPDMMKNFSSMMSNNTQDNNTQNTNTQNTSQNNGTQSSNQANANQTNDNTNQNPLNNFDFSKIDPNMMMKMKSMMDNMGGAGANDPRSNLLQSLKPYLREERKDKVDQYANLLNVAKIAGMSGIFNNDKKDNKNG